MLFLNVSPVSPVYPTVETMKIVLKLKRNKLIQSSSPGGLEVERLLHMLHDSTSVGSNPARRQKMISVVIQYNFGVTCCGGLRSQAHFKKVIAIIKKKRKRGKNGIIVTDG